MSDVEGGSGEGGWWRRGGETHVSNYREAHVMSNSVWFAPASATDGSRKWNKPGGLVQ